MISVSRNKERGFALPLLLALLPCGLAALLAGYAFVGFIQIDLGYKHACRSEGLLGQAKVAPLLQKLLSLNPKALKLKTELELAYAAQAAALATGNHALLPAIRSRITAIKMKRKWLDAEQRQLIAQSRIYLTRAFQRTRQTLSSRAGALSNSFLRTNLQLDWGTPPALAVRPDYPDIAPTYSPLETFEERQALAHQWQYTIEVRQPFSHFLPAQFKFSKSCKVSLRQEGSRWRPQIIKGKSSLRSVW